MSSVFLVKQQSAVRCPWREHGPAPTAGRLPRRSLRSPEEPVFPTQTMDGNKAQPLVWAGAYREVTRAHFVFQVFGTSRESDIIRQEG